MKWGKNTYDYVYEGNFDQNQKFSGKGTYLSIKVNSKIPRVFTKDNFLMVKNMDLESTTIILNSDMKVTINTIKKKDKAK